MRLSGGGLRRSLVPNRTPLHLAVLHALAKLLVCDAVHRSRIGGAGIAEFASGPAPFDVIYREDIPSVEHILSIENIFYLSSFVMLYMGAAA